VPVLACVERPVKLEFHAEEVIVTTCQFIDAIVRPVWGDSGLFCIISFTGCLVFLVLYSQGGLLRSGVCKVYLCGHIKFQILITHVEGGADYVQWGKKCRCLNPDILLSVRLPESTVDRRKKNVIFMEIGRI